MYFEDDEPDGTVVLSGKKRIFSKELRCLMYGFGDDQNPYTESVELLEDLVIEFITDMTHKAMEIGRTGRVQVEDIVFLVRKDQRKYARVKDLLTMNEELKKARKAFDEVKYADYITTIVRLTSNLHSHDHKLQTAGAIAIKMSVDRTADKINTSVTTFVFMP
ncbi:Transcription initiation factor TFIID subunit 13 [Homalodisca vitripennis]|nr:Transcription initiation factor TFIID subunit 13 [Homalodisca vitripennis]